MPRRRGAAVAALVAVLSPPLSAVTLVDQTDRCTNNNSASSVTSETVAGQSFYNSLVADDFFVPAGATWTINFVAPLGSYFVDSGTLAPASSFNVYFYDGANGAPLHLLPACTNLALVYDTYPLGPLETFFDLVLTAPCILTGGAGGTAYWISIQANMTLGTDWGWQERYAQSGNAAHVEYPGGAGGDACRVWSLKTDCVGAFTAQYPDQCFQLAGTAPVIFRGGFDP